MYFGIYISSLDSAIIVKYWKSYGLSASIDMKNSGYKDWWVTNHKHTAIKLKYLNLNCKGFSGPGTKYRQI